MWKNSVIGGNEASTADLAAASQTLSVEAQPFILSAANASQDNEAEVPTTHTDQVISSLCMHASTIVMPISLFLQFAVVQFSFALYIFRGRVYHDIFC